MKRVWVLFSLVLLMASPLMARPKIADINGDGVVGPLEKRAAQKYRAWRDAHPGMLPDEPLDINEDGIIGPGEREAYRHFIKVMWKIKKARRDRELPPGQQKKIEPRPAVPPRPPAARPAKPVHPLGGPPGQVRRNYFRNFAQQMVNRMRVRRYGGYFSVAVSASFGLKENVAQVGPQVKYQITQVVGINASVLLDPEKVSGDNSLANVYLGLNLNLNPGHRVNPYIDGGYYLVVPVNGSGEQVKGFFAGGGLELFLTPKTAFVLGYMRTFVENADADYAIVKLNIYF